MITDVPENPSVEFNRRRRRYAIMMGARVLCLIAAALLYRESAWLALAFIVGGAVLPWCAVIIANDRPPKKRQPAPAYVATSGERALPAAPRDRPLDDEPRVAESSG